MPLDAATFDAGIDRERPDTGAPSQDAEVVEDAGAELSGPGEACKDGEDCEVGACAPVAGGLCAVTCRADGECPESTTCAEIGLEGGTCVSVCRGGQCRNGWGCDEAVAPPACLPACEGDGDECPEGTECDADGLCRVPRCSEEVCDDSDNDCDGVVDEAVLNACGACGAPPDESCNDEDDDCDGETDEGTLNACGQCGELPPDLCDGEDQDCDGALDEDAACGQGSVCVEGACLALPGGACENDVDCASGVCDRDLPGGWCNQQCGLDADCGPGAECANVGEENFCFVSCDAEAGCRPGYACIFEEEICFPRCTALDWCGEVYDCDALSGACVLPLVRVVLSGVTVAPFKVNPPAVWDGVGSVPNGAVEALGAVLGLPAPLAGLAGLFANDAVASLARPDPAGFAEFATEGADPVRFGLGEIGDSFTPQWRDVAWDLLLDPGADNRLVVELDDVDLVNDDTIGRATLNTQDLLDALRVEGVHQVWVQPQGLQQILAISIEVRRL
jgi:hypothetical protein